MDWATYLSVPFVDGGRDTNGWDCWGCIAYVSRVEFDRPLPEYLNHGLECDRVSVRQLRDDFARYHDQYTPISDPAPGDIVLLQPRRLPIHVGLIVDRDPLRMIHAERSVGTVVEKVYGPMWCHRIEGFYRA